MKVPFSLRSLAVAVSLVVLFGWALFVPVTHAKPRPRDTVTERGGGGGLPDFSLAAYSVAAGLPRAWHAGAPVGLRGVANLSNGNLVTAIPIIAWKPVGPPVGFAMFHNSIRSGELVS